jgi:hypothetical protein
MMIVFIKKKVLQVVLFASILHTRIFIDTVLMSLEQPIS